MMSRQTGRAIGPLDHLKQSIQDILTTRIGTRIQREEYGSLLADFIDAPKTAALKLQIIAACVIALAQWEPRLIVRGVQFVRDEHTKVGIVISGEVNGQAINIEGINLA